VCGFNLPWFEELLIVAAVLLLRCCRCVCSFNLLWFEELLTVAAVVVEMLVVCV